jgi:PleD family two-component response regulator
VSSDRFMPGSLGAEDLTLFSKFASYVEQAIANALEHAHARRFQNFDEDTGLPNAADVRKRIDEELARAGRNDSPLAIAICRIENLREIENQTDAAHARRVVQRTADGLRAQVRDFDVAARTAEDEFTVLLRDPGAAAGERVFALARGVAEHVARSGPCLPGRRRSGAPRAARRSTATTWPRRRCSRAGARSSACRR